jgi:hypothetical protein
MHVLWFFRFHTIEERVRKWRYNVYSLSEIRSLEISLYSEGVYYIDYFFSWYTGCTDCLTYLTLSLLHYTTSFVFWRPIGFYTTSLALGETTQLVIVLDLYDVTNLRFGSLLLVYFGEAKSVMFDIVLNRVFTVSWELVVEVRMYLTASFFFIIGYFYNL